VRGWVLINKLYIKHKLYYIINTYMNTFSIIIFISFFLIFLFYIIKIIFIIYNTILFNIIF